jgi:hypothetical protein
MKTSFFLCHNPIGVLPKGCVGYVYHSGKPRFLAGMLKIDPAGTLQDLDYDGYNVLFRYVAGDGIEQVYLLLVAQNIDRATTKLTRALQEAAEWYVDCLSKTDVKMYNKNSQWSFFSDFNLFTPGVQVVHLKITDKYLLSFEDGVKTFDDMKTMDQFLRQSLGFTDVHLEAGSHNVIDRSATHK